MEWQNVCMPIRNNIEWIRLQFNFLTFSVIWWSFFWNDVSHWWNMVSPQWSEDQTTIHAMTAPGFAMVEEINLKFSREGHGHNLVWKGDKGGILMIIFKRVKQFMKILICCFDTRKHWKKNIEKKLRKDVHQPLSECTIHLTHQILIIQTVSNPKRSLKGKKFLNDLKVTAPKSTVFQSPNIGIYFKGLK